MPSAGPAAGPRHRQFPDEAHALAGLGRCALATDDIAQAQDLLRQVREIFQRIGAAGTVLRTLTG